nr:organic cation/carnitine transporter 4-like [Ipomoea batatas]
MSKAWQLHSEEDMDLRAAFIPAAAADGGAKLERLTIDDMLQKHCGEFGWWQLKHFVLTSLAWALEGIHTMVMIFADRDPGWRCTSANSDCPSAGSDVCKLEPGSWEWEGGPESSTMAEFGLICGHKYQVGLVQALFFAGCMIVIFRDRMIIFSLPNGNFDSRFNGDVEEKKFKNWS